MKMAKEFKISFLIVTASYLVLGLVLLFYPAFSTTMLCYALGGITILYGVSHIVSYFSRTDFAETYNLDLVTGIVMTGCGIYIMVQPAVVTAVLNIVVGLAVCLDSLIKLQNSIDLKRLGSRVWWTVLVLSLITGLLGVLLLFYRGAGLLPVTQLIGISLVVDGCVNVWSFVFLSVNLRHLRKTRRQAADESTQEFPAAPARDADEARVQSAVCLAEQEQPDDSVKSGILCALRARKKKNAPVEEAPAAAEAEEPAVAASLVLKPTAAELDGASRLPDAPAAPADAHADAHADGSPAAAAVMAADSTDSTPAPTLDK